MNAIEGVGPFDALTRRPIVGTPFADHEVIALGPNANGSGSSVMMVGVLNDSLTLGVRVRVSADDSELESDSDTNGFVNDGGSDAVAERETDRVSESERDIVPVALGSRVDDTLNESSRVVVAVVDKEPVSEGDCVALTVRVGVATAVGVGVTMGDRVWDGVGNVFVRPVAEA
jgi:hypothetical protein